MRTQFIQLYCEVMNAYPQRGGARRTAFRNAMKTAMNALDEVKNQGDSASLEEHSKEWEPHWYYPGPDQSERYLTRLWLMEKREVR